MRVIIPSMAEANEDELKEAVVASYNKLFEDLNTEYGDFFATLTPALTVNNIVTFYRGIRAIIADGHQSLPKPRYFRLPLDEPNFEINMDTRTISVPSVFSVNGLGVKGDANAEVVFFKCDRYYDGIDLGAMTPGITDNNDPSKYNCVVQWQNAVSGAAGNSQVILADTEENYIVFGWMITQKMTSRPGTINFAVRWMQLDDGEITYSVSTQTASCTVKSTIDLDYDTLQVENVQDIVYHRPFYSGIINSMAGSSPQVTTGLTTATRNLEALDEEDPLLVEYPIETYPDGILQLEVSATSPDGNPIVYQWYNGDAIINGATARAYNVTAPGKYFVKIGNDGTADGVGIRYVTTETVTVPAPDQIKFDQTNWFGDGTYSDGDAAHKPTVSVVNVNGQAPNGAVTYTWKKADMLKTVNDVTTVVPLADLTDADYTVVDGAPNEPSYQPPVGTEAYYKCEVVNHLNNTDSNVIKTAQPAMIRAIPKAPLSVTIAFDEANQLLKVTNINWGTGPAQYHPDEIRYEWRSAADGTYSSSVGYGDRYSQFSVAGLTLKNGQTWDSDFSCYVSHIVYRNNNGGQERQGGQTLSTTIKLYVVIENGQPKVTAINPNA